MENSQASSMQGCVAASSTGEKFVMSEALSMWNRMRLEHAVFNTDDDDNNYYSDSSSNYSSDYENDSSSSTNYETRTCGFVNKKENNDRDNAAVQNDNANDSEAVSSNNERVKMAEALAFYNRMAVEKAVFDSDDDDNNGNDSDSNEENESFELIDNRQRDYDNVNDDSFLFFGPPRTATPAISTNIANNEIDTTDADNAIEDLRTAFRNLMQTIIECEEVLDDADDIDGSSSDCSDSDSFHTARSHKSESEGECTDDDSMDILMEEEEPADPPIAAALYRLMHDEYEEERACNAARMQTLLEVVGINARFPKRTSEGASKEAIITNVGASSEGKGKRKRARELNEDDRYDFCSGSNSDDELEEGEIREPRRGYGCGSDLDDEDELEEGEIREVSAYVSYKKCKVSHLGE